MLRPQGYGLPVVVVVVVEALGQGFDGVGGRLEVDVVDDLGLPPQKVGNGTVHLGCVVEEQVEVGSVVFEDRLDSKVDVVTEGDGGRSFAHGAPGAPP